MFSIEKSVLLVIDVQGKLAYLMHEKEKLFKHIRALIQAAKHLSIPVIYTEQVPEKIGTTIPEIKELLPDLAPITKASFSCCGSTEFVHHLQSLKRKEIIVCGIETHVCVYQTIRDLMTRKYDIQLVSDAVSSRSAETKEIALTNLQTHGIKLTSAEMIMCELLRTSTHPKFKDVLKLIR